MGWFDEQIRQRKRGDEEAFTDAFSRMAGAVTGIYAALDSDRCQTRNALYEILKFYHIRPREIPDEITGREEQMEYLLRPYGIMRRTVHLSPGWHHDAIGAMLGVRKSGGAPVAFLPDRLSGYSCLDAATGKRIKITHQNEGDFEAEAIAFYKPFPLRSLGIPDLLRFMAQTLSGADLTLLAFAALAVSLTGMLIPYIQRLMFTRVIPSGSVSLLGAASVFLACASVCVLLLNSVKELLSTGISTKLSMTVQSAAMMRVLSLPAHFFKQYSVGELTSRMQYLHQLCALLADTVLGTGFTAVFSMLYLSQVFLYEPALVLPSFLVLLAAGFAALISAWLQTRVSRKQLALASRESGMNFSLISGVQKIKLSGAEKRAFARWGRIYAEEAGLTYQPPLFLKLHSVIQTAIPLVGMVVLYRVAAARQMSPADFYAFSTVYGILSGVLLELAQSARTVARMKPILELAEPILSTVPEVSENKQVLSRLSGGIELNNVSFRYQEDMPLILDNLSLKIRPGQYIAIVGKTGCGKSTLLRLLLGFETPQKGAVYFDGRDLTQIDLKSLRRKIGVVMQNGKLFPGDIYSNIAISAPGLTLDQAWEAAEAAGIADDIRAMPMGMNTMISEGGGTISGGQRQRLLIARAIAPKPKILLFDEATSALDNSTQKKVSDALGKLKCTRIVIAHRLSTIRQCSRIIVLDGGKIIEDGNYDALIAHGGLFADLVARQRLDIGSGAPEEGAPLR